MMDDTHIADGIAVKLLLAGIVLASAAVGALGLASVTSQTVAGGPADDPSAQLAFPIDNFSANVGSQLLSLDGKGNDPYPAALSVDTVTAAFPIDNFSATGAPRDAKGTDRIGGTGIGSPGVKTWALALDGVPDALSQDMDPY